MGNGAQRRRMRVGEWLVEPSLNQLTRNGIRHRIEPRKMELLCVLASRPGELVTTEELLETVWHGTVVTQSSVYQSVAQLRRLLGDSSDRPAYIETISRKGYRLIAPVEEAIEETVPETIEEAPGATIPERRPQRWIRWSVAALLVAIGVGYWLLPGTWRPQWSFGVSEPVAIAVLPFADLSDSKADQQFSDGLSEAVLNGLARIPGLQVAARNSSFSSRDVSDPLPELARRLGVSHLLQGSVRRAGQTISVSVSLHEGKAGRRIWNGSYDRDGLRSVDLQAEITRDVAERLRVLSGSLRTRIADQAADINVDAYDLYLLGMANVVERTPDKIARARDYFRTAIDLDPKFGPAYVGLARSHIAAYYYSGLELKTTAARAQPLLERALTLDPLLAEAHATQGLLRVEQLELPEAELDLRRAISLNPNFSDAYLWLGLAAANDGRPLDALAQYEKASRLDPLNFIIFVRMGLESGSVGKFEDSERFARRALELAPSHPNVPWIMAFNDMLRGRLEDSIAGYRRALKIDPVRPIFWSQLAWVLLDSGRVAEAEEAFSRVGELSAERTEALLEQAQVAVASGEPRQIREFMDRHQLNDPASHELSLSAAYLEFLGGRIENARRLYDRALPIALTQPLRADPWDVRWGRSTLLDAASFYWLTGQSDVARPILRQVRERLDRFERNGNVWAGLWYLRARMHALEGDASAALAALEEAYRRGWRRAWWMRFDPCLRPLAGQPAFRALLERIERDVQTLAGES